MPRTLYLYTTLGCHLCDDAKVLAWPVLQHFDCRLQEVEIADDEQLVEHYGIRIPVIRCEASGKELGWPFTQEQLAEMLTNA